MDKAKYGLIMAGLAALAVFSIVGGGKFAAFMALVRASTALFTIVSMVPMVQFLFREYVGLQATFALTPLLKPQEITPPSTNEMEKEIKELITLIAMLIAVLLI